MIIPKAKGAINKALSHVSLRLMDMSEPLGAEQRIGLDLLSFIVPELGRRYGRRLRLVQIGANDGVSEDSVAPLIREGLVEAVLVEPFPEAFAALEALHASTPGVHLEQVAIGLQPGSLPLYVPLKGDGTIATSKICSLDRDQVADAILRRGPNEPEVFGENPRVGEVVVDVITVTELLRRCDWDDADVFVIDAEGLDVALVEGILAAGLRPKVIQFESVNIPRRDFPGVAGLLNRNGYRFARSGFDVIAVRGDA